jgi:hypothetical protein
MTQPPLSHEATTIVSQLPGAVTELGANKTSLRQGEVALRAFDGRHTALVEAHQAVVSQVVQEHATLIFESYGYHLRHVIEAALGVEEGSPMQLPSLAVCERISTLDDQVRAAAGQPIVVIQPGQALFNIGRLEQPEEPAEKGGLRLAGKPRDKTNVAELPINGSITINRKTGLKARWEEDDYVQERPARTRHGSFLRQAIDPLNTLLITADESDIQLDQDTAPEIACILVGYRHLQHVLNATYGFDATQDQPENYEKFLAAAALREKLERLDINFDMDYLDGHLALRIHMMEQRIQGQEPHNVEYELSVLKGLVTKQAELVATGWLKTLS